ncbi:MAG: UDP-N-acetylmuramoyl-tripeptide--D-alanyl-D-alanine ligase, partial [Oscillospiraceae bacterium]|nr:UDP-N-acetylmuramoyl-tripeptide--D-alanyl-D-alanine ligase [Oscillospiraceae bacterium]
NVLMTPESYNTTMGVVRTIRERLRPSHQVFIAEMGAKNPGDIREICDLVHPRYGILTSIGEQHLETFKTIDNIIATKFELADAIQADGCVFLNTDNDYIRAHPVGVPHVAYGTAPDADYRASDIVVDAGGCAFTVTAPDGESQRFTTKLLGGHNIQNLTGCIALAHRLGIPLSKLVYPIRMLRPVEHRLQLLPNGFIDDAYNSNPAGFRSALDVLAGFDAQRVLVTPGMVELGERQEALNRELGEYAAARCDYAVLVGEKQAPPLKEGLLRGGFPEERIYVAATLQDGLAHLNALPAAPRIVLLENDLPDNF